MNRKLYAMLNAKQEAVAQTCAEDPNGAEAVRAAGSAPSAARQEGHRLRADPEIAERTEAHHLAAAERRARVAEELMAKLEPIYAAGMAAGAHGRALEAVALQARIAGLTGWRGHDGAGRKSPKMSMNVYDCP